MTFLSASKWLRPFGHHLWKRKNFLLAVVVVVLFILLVAQYRDIDTNSPNRPSPISWSKSVARHPNVIKNPFALLRPDSDNGNFNAAQSSAVLPRPLPVHNVHFKNYENSQIDKKNVQSISFPMGEPSDPEIRMRREHIKQMMNFAWTNYVKYAWGDNELKPVSKKAHLQGIFGATKLGATIIDSMDTLFIMGMHEEFNKGREWIKNELSLNEHQGELSVFETTIRFVGGLLTCYALTRDKLFLDKAKEIADALLPAFNSETGIPYSLINLRTKVPKNYQWASASSYSILAEIGSLHLEFVYLSELTGDPIYKEKVIKIRDILRKSPKPKGLYPIYIHPQTGKWGQHHFSIGALGDSFYEYLLKAWIQSGGEDTVAREMYDDAIASMEKHLLKKSKHGLYYFADMKYERIEQKMDHLACFSGGLLTLGAVTSQSETKNHYLQIGAELTNTCHESYIKTRVRLGPECFRFSESVEAEATRHGEKYFILRPETIESYFYLWRTTKDSKYREWAWDAALAIEKYCKVEAGYSGLRDVTNENSPKDDVQQSFLTAETLKYLYLVFSEDDLLPLEQWVFNTEAHPLPVKGKNPFYFTNNATNLKDFDSPQASVAEEGDRGKTI